MSRSMMKCPLAPVACAVATAVLLAACDGDSRPFEEAVEISELNIRSLQVMGPSSTVDELILNIGESVDFSVQGVNTASQTLELEAFDRDWRVSDPAVASIDSNGRLTALANGDVSVGVQIGGLDATAFELQVSDAELVAVESIVGDDTIERCVPAEYQARGTFDDGTVRDLSGVSWSLASEDSDNARIVSSPDINVQLTGLNAGGVTLMASRDDVSLSRLITISSSLAALAITPSSATVDVDDTVDFVATGSFDGAAPGDESDDTAGSRQIVVTNAVTWQIVTGTDQASVSNAEGMRGQVTGLAVGSATVNAACGSFEATAVPITVTDNVVDSLSFSQGTRLELDPDDSDGVLLLVSSGDTYSASDRLDNDDLEWEFTRSGTTDAIELEDEDDDEPGRIRPLVQSGVGTVTVTHPDGASASIIIEVTDS